MKCASSIASCVAFRMLRFLDWKNLFYYSPRKQQYLRKSANICEKWLWVVICWWTNGHVKADRRIFCIFVSKARKMNLKDQNDILFSGNRNLKTMCDLYECVMTDGGQNREIVYMAPCGRIRGFGVTAHISTRCTARTILITVNSIFEWPFREGSDPLQSRSWAVSISAFSTRTRRCSQEETKEKKMRTWSVKGLWFVRRLFVDNFGNRNCKDNILFGRIPLMLVFEKSWVQISVCRWTISTDIGIFKTLPVNAHIASHIGPRRLPSKFFFRIHYLSVVVQ